MPVADKGKQMKTLQTTLLAISFFGVAPALADTLSVSPATFAASVGQAFTLDIVVSSAVDLYAYQFDIGFDSSILQATSITEGSFLSTAGATFFIPGTIDNVGGTIAATAGSLTGASGANGSGTLVTIGFRAIGAGTSAVNVFNDLALNSFGEGLTETTSGGSVRVTGTATAPEPGSLLLLGTVTFLAAVALRRTRAGRSLA